MVKQQWLVCVMVMTVIMVLNLVLTNYKKILMF